MMKQINLYGIGINGKAFLRDDNKFVQICQ